MIDLALAALSILLLYGVEISVSSKIKKRANERHYRKLQDNFPYERAAMIIRCGAIAPLAAILMSFMCLLMAFVIDHAYMGLVKAEAQRCADSGALAGAGALHVNNALELTKIGIGVTYTGEGHDTARQFVDLHVNNVRPGDYTTDPNSWNTEGGDIIVGRFQDGVMTPDDVQPNAVQVTIHIRRDHTNGSAGLFFPNLNGIFETSQTAIARVDYPTLLPFTTSEDKWNTLASGGDGDNFGDDGIPEVFIFPGAWNGVGMPPGNFGAIQIGANSSAATLMRQIDKGPSANDMAFHGNQISVGDTVSGQTGMVATVEKAFMGGSGDYEGIIGQPRFLALYSSASGNGTNSQFVIKKFVAVKIMHVDLQGNTKYLAVQPITEGSNVHQLRLVK